MAMGTYAAIDRENAVIDIVEMDILSNTPAPYGNGIGYIRVGEPTPTPIPTIGQIWNGETFE